ncbi:gliding motility-associated C-terminal domain-containing protein [Parasediminibacterium paludis]|uniref:Gliding motility-associated C-terminal domain-containing protein n=1 Tax=Parasediminibacterium paludis TaxID=908966 RepID=A0ABV8Q1I5_9BACT
MYFQQRLIFLFCLLLCQNLVKAAGIHELKTTIHHNAILLDTLIVTNDTNICKGQSVPIQALPAFSYAWTPKTGLNDTAISNPVATPVTTTKYLLQTQTIGNNLVVNGDFSAGNTGFTSQYLYSLSGIPEGVYFVGTNSYPWHPFLNPHVDHTTGTGNMLLVNGDTVFNIIIWKQDISVIPNTNYIFSVWLQSIYSGNPAELQFSINGNPVGNIFKASATEGQWQQFYTTWQSGNTTNASISVINKDTIRTGNDFALDDIVFAPLLVDKDSITITVVNKPVLALNADTAICTGTALQLRASGASSYVWQANSYLSSTTIANPIAMPLKDTSFIVIGYNLPNCFSSDTVNVHLLPTPTFSIIGNSGFCKGDSTTLQIVGANGTYSWQPSASLSNTTIANPIAKPLVTTQYNVTVTDANKCSTTDSVVVIVNQPPNLVLTKDNDINCVKAVTTLHANGGAKYYWYPTQTLQYAATANPIATPSTTTIYHVKSYSDQGCYGEDSILVTVSNTPSDVGYQMPSAFTPNGDGINDCFGVKKWGNVSHLQLDIYNRFGERIFSGYDSNACWDGTYKGVAQPLGTYVYQVVATTNCGEVYRKGTVVLIR